MIRVCPHSDRQCEHGMDCTFSCATADYNGTKVPLAKTLGRTPSPTDEEIEVAVISVELRRHFDHETLEGQAERIIHALDEHRARIPIPDAAVGAVNLAVAYVVMVDGWPDRVFTSSRDAEFHRFCLREKSVQIVLSTLSLATYKDREAQAQGWRDIASAPRDGTVVDLWSADSEERIAGAWWSGSGKLRKNEEHRWYAPNYDYDGEAGWIGNGMKITHYMPLPAPPIPQEKTP